MPQLANSNMNTARARATRTAIAATIAFAGGVIIMANQFAPCVRPAPQHPPIWLAKQNSKKRTRSKYGGIIIIIIVCIRYNAILVALDKEIAASPFNVCFWNFIQSKLWLFRPPFALQVHRHLAARCRNWSTSDSRSSCILKSTGNSENYSHNLCHMRHDWNSKGKIDKYWWIVWNKPFCVCCRTSFRFKKPPTRRPSAKLRYMHP